MTRPAPGGSRFGLGSVAWLAIALMLVAVAAAQVASAWGFSSGMTAEDVQRVAAQLGISLVTDDNAPGRRTIGMYRCEADSDAGIGYVATLCRGRLQAIKMMTRGSIGTFLDTWSDLERRYGAPVVIRRAAHLERRREAIVQRARPRVLEPGIVRESGVRDRDRRKDQRRAARLAHRL